MKAVYGSRWRKARATFLARHPLCLFCEQVGKVTAADTVHHSEAHRGDAKRFWNVAKWVACCKPCHDRYGQMQDQGKLIPGCNEDGQPLDENHYWNRGI